MNKLLTISALVLSLSGGVAFAQDTTGGQDTDGSAGNTTTGADADNGAGTGTNNASDTDFSGTDTDTAAGTTNAPNAPFLGNRDNVGTFYSDEGMTTMYEGDDFANAYNALTDEQRAAIVTECASPAGFERFCDAFTTQGTTAQ
ncbi:MAG TPA: hypothetical protein VGN97_20675 [Mesorhizobium sp.]|jgi:hypothetical protein|nr:hypothetical protein [Mesorhizobium sp.]